MTSETMGWLNQNRYRSYPMCRDEWREKVSPGSGLDRVLLDALVFDGDSDGARDLAVTRISVSRSETRVSFKYGEEEFNVVLSGGEQSGEGSYERVHGSISCGGMRNATFSLAFSSHAYISDVLPDGEWELGCHVLPSRVLCMSDGFGVDCVSTNGSAGVEGREDASDASGDVVLEDGYRTSPVISNGRVLVRVGRRYGLDPCAYDFSDGGRADCRKPLFFFCGQNAVNGGNVVLKGGAGVNVAQGRGYAVRDGTCAGKVVPAIEIVADKRLLDIYKPSGEQSQDSRKMV